MKFKTMKKFRHFIYLILFSVIQLPAQNHSLKMISHEDMINFWRVGAPKISPDGQWVIFSQGKTTYNSDDNTSDLYLAKTDGTEKPRKITNSKTTESDYFWHPNGKKIFFVAKREGDEAAQLYSLSFEMGGEAERLTNISTGVMGPKINTKGDMVLFQSKVYPKAFSDSISKKLVEEKKKIKYKARVFTTFPVRYFDQWLDEKQAHLFTLDLSTQKIQNLFENCDLVNSIGYGLGSFEFSPNQNEVVFTASTDLTTAAYQNPSYKIYQISLRGKGKEKQIISDDLDYNTVRFSNDGKYLLATGNAQSNKLYYTNRLYRFDYPACSNRTELVAQLDRPINALEIIDEGILASVEDQGYDKIIKIKWDNSGFSIVKGGNYGAFASLSAEKSGKIITYQQEAVNAPLEVYTQISGKEISISKANEEMLAKLDLVRPIEFWTNTRGKKVRSVLVKPAHFDPSKKYPLFVLMHGGPASSFKDSFGYRWNPYVLASDKMVIVMTDYTGSVGYGEKFAQDIQFDPFKGPGQEILDAAKDAIKRFDFIDESRQAAGGASYGGHLANWMQATTTHFKCLVSHAGLMNSEEQWGTSDVIWGRELMNGGAPWVPTKTWKEQNPMRFAANFKTPILYTVGENDFRVPINNTLTSWSITQRLKIPAKLIVFPEENHWILKPENSRFHYKEIMDWIGKYL
ncbi:MAG: Acylaminoacyl-peptidase [Bacteroidota bacterium]|jgi:dipeptidyl aminopeptidase/acylaminoacyl peptidase